jgi:hypothetical protein
VRDSLSEDVFYRVVAFHIAISYGVEENKSNWGKTVVIVAD